MGSWEVWPLVFSLPLLSQVEWSIWKLRASEQIGTDCPVFWEGDCRPLPLVEPLSQTLSPSSPSQAQCNHVLPRSDHFLFLFMHPSPSPSQLGPCQLNSLLSSTFQAKIGDGPKKAQRRRLFPSFLLPPHQLPPPGKNSLGFYTVRLPFHYFLSPKAKGTRQKLSFNKFSGLCSPASLNIWVFKQFLLSCFCAHLANISKGFVFPSRSTSREKMH